MCFRTRRRALIPTLRVAAEKEPIRQSFTSKAGGGQEIFGSLAMSCPPIIQSFDIAAQICGWPKFWADSIENLDKRGVKKHASESNVRCLFRRYREQWFHLGHLQER
jgi:hypothetical protein